MENKDERIPLVMSWSGGKDSALALHELLGDNRCRVVGLMTTLAQESRRVSHHGVREALLEAQARAAGLPLTKIYLPSGPSGHCSNEVYERIMGRAMAEFRSRGIHTIGFGDLFLEDLRACEANLAKAGMKGVFPLWKRDTALLARRMMAMGFKAVLTCVEAKVGHGFAGREFDAALLDDLPQGIDPCGEFGEFHTFVHAAPCFSTPIPTQLGQIAQRDGRYQVDLLLQGDGATC